jgi:predicted MFS family arabinose efflux permease
MTPIATHFLFAMFGLSLGILIGYYFHWREYRAVIGFVRAARHHARYQALEKQFEQGEQYKKGELK